MLLTVFTVGFFLFGCYGKSEADKSAAPYEFPFQSYYNMLKPFAEGENYEEETDLDLKESIDGYFSSGGRFRYDSAKDPVTDRPGDGGRWRRIRRFRRNRRPIFQRNFALPPGFRPFYVPYPMPFYY